MDGGSYKLNIMNSYQKLKQENKLLKESLREVVLNPNSIKSLGIKTTIKMRAKMEESFMFGSIRKCITGKCSGIKTLVS